MYRVLLADDEKIVTDSITMMINRNFPGQFEVQTAKNGRYLIEIFNSFHPDIVITDIQMPGINGITAIKDLVKTNQDTIFVIMTAYDRFEYAKDALNIGVAEFMNKPFNDRDIAELLQRCIRKIEARRKELSDSLKIQEKMESVIPFIENGFIYSMLFSEKADEEDIDNYRQLLEVEERYGCMLIIAGGEAVRDRHMTNAVGSGVRLYQNYATVKEHIRRVWSKAIVGSVISNRIPVFLPMEKEELEYEERIEILEKSRKLTRELQSVTERVFRIGIGSVVSVQEGMRSFQEAAKALSITEGSAVHIEDISAQRYCEEDDQRYTAELEKRLLAGMKKGDVDTCANTASEYFEWMVNTYGEKDMSVRMKLLELVLRAEETAEMNSQVSYHFSYRADYMPKVYLADSNSDLKIWFLNCLKAACENINSGAQKQENSVIEKAKIYIKENYTWDISLDDVSRKFKLTPYYFSKLFKQETGSTFVEYLTGIRMETAREMLKNPERSVKEIGISVGYSDPNYFSRIFKKVMGVTPSEYRENH